MVRVTLETVTKKFDDFTAVDNIDLEIKDKEFFVLLGPSGCGKTTILNMIAGLEPITEGRIYFDDIRVDTIPPEKRDVAMVFQSYALYPHMNAFDNIAFSLKIKKVPKEKIKKRIEDTADMLGIRWLLNKKPHEMSGGERQRVALARAIVRHPKAFLLDEPLSNVDAKLRVHMRAELIRLQEKLETTLIYVTHDQVEAMTMAQRVAIMSRGKIIQVDDPLKVYQHPDDLFVAGFIGSPPMNFFDCSLAKKNGRAILDASEFSIGLPDHIADVVEKKATDISKLILGTRPPHISLYKQRSAKESIKCEVYALEPLGDDVIVDLKIGAHIVKTLTHMGFVARIGDTVWALIDKDKMHIFDGKTRKCIV